MKLQSVLLILFNEQNKTN